MYLSTLKILINYKESITCRESSCIGNNDATMPIKGVGIVEQL